LQTSLLEPAKGRTIDLHAQLAAPGFAALLLVEVLALTSRFDSQALVNGGSRWGALVGYARYLPQIVMASAAAVLVLTGRGSSASQADIESDTLAAEPQTRGFWPWLLLAGHLLMFGALVALTQEVWEGSLGRSQDAAAWFAAWLAVGSASLALGLTAVLPAAAWTAWFRRSSKVLTAGVVVAATACLAGQATSWLEGPLNAATFAVVRGALGLLFADAVADPAARIVGTGDFRVEIAPQCSGYEGIGLVWVFLGAYLWFCRRELRFPQALWLLPVGTVVIWLANAARIVALVALGARISPAVALGGFHSQAGWLAFNAVALGLVAVSRRGRFFAKDTELDVNDDRAEMNPTAAFLAPLLALVAAVMVTTALSLGTGFDALYPVRIVAVAAALWVYRKGYANLIGSWSWPAVGIGVVVFAVWMALEPSAAAGSSELAAGLAGLPKGMAILWLVARTVGSVVTVPIAEELAFRGYLTRRLIAQDFTSIAPGRFTWLSFVASSFLFGAMHGRFVAGTLAGALYTVALYRKGELSDAVLAHAVTNALIAGYVLTTGAWSLWV
jgi:exosortase E/protease (VPEID-CTERM system)